MKLLCLCDIRKDIIDQFPKQYEVICKDKKELQKTDVEDAEVIIGNLPLELIPHAKKCKYLQLESAGNDRYLNIREDITLCNASGSFGTAIAEYVIGQLIAFHRNFYAYHDAKKSGDWSKRLGGCDLHRKTLLVLGCGDVGSHIAKLAKAFDCYVIGVRTTRKHAPYMDEVWECEKLAELESKADIVINTLPHTDMTKHLLTIDDFNRMQKHAIFVNVGRGSVVALDVLCEALSNKEIQGAILDVYEYEPLPKNHPLWKMDHVVMTPHIAGTFETEDSRFCFEKLILENLKAWILGKPLKNIVNRMNQY